MTITTHHEESERGTYTEISEAHPAPSRYVRSGNCWRRPTFHIATQVLTTEIEATGVHAHPSLNGTTEGVGTACGGGYDGLDHTFVDEIPDGCELCQICAEKLAAAKRKADQIATPDRSAYHRRTEELMREVWS